MVRLVPGRSDPRLLSWHLVVPGNVLVHYLLVNVWIADLPLRWLTVLNRLAVPFRLPLLRWTSARLNALTPLLLGEPRTDWIPPVTLLAELANFDGLEDGLAWDRPPALPLLLAVRRVDRGLGRLDAADRNGPSVTAVVNVTVVVMVSSSVRCPGLTCLNWLSVWLRRFRCLSRLFPCGALLATTASSLNGRRVTALDCRWVGCRCCRGLVCLSCRWVGSWPCLTVLIALIALIALIGTGALTVAVVAVVLGWGWLVAWIVAFLFGAFALSLFWLCVRFLYVLFVR